VEVGGRADCEEDHEEERLEVEDCRLRGGLACGRGVRDGGAGVTILLSLIRSHSCNFFASV
jgi:hypothetical protein